jgi:hypothetical protein
MTDETIARSRLRRLPPIRRARLWRLYAEDGRRFLDFWMDDGRSILGAKGTGIGTTAKAALDTGLTRPFPSIRESRLEKDIHGRYPDYPTIRLFRDEARATAAAEPLLRTGEKLPTLRPFASYLGVADAMPRVAMPRLPCPAALAPAVLLFREPEIAEGVEGDIVPPLALACAHRALAEFDRFLADYSEALWKKVDRRLGPYFERRGPYLFPRVAEAERRGSPSADYDRLFDTALGAGVLLSPDPERPSIIPGDFDDGELARLATAIATIKL